MKVNEPHPLPLHLEEGWDEALQACKPVSVFARQFTLIDECYHLSAIAITGNLYLPTLDPRASSPQVILYMAFQHVRFARYYHYW